MIETQTFTVVPVLQEFRMNAQGLCPVAIRVTIARKSTYRSTSLRIRPEHWDASKKEVIGTDNCRLLNAAIRKQMTQVHTELMSRQVTDQPISVGWLRSGALDTVELLAFCQGVRGDNGMTNTQYQRVVNFLGRKPLLQDFTVGFLRRYENYLRGGGGKVYEPTTINAAFKYWRRILNQAKAEGYITMSPFTEFRVPKYIQPKRNFLEQDELDQVYGLLEKQLDPTFYKYLCYFLLGCYTGLRYSDWVNFNEDNRNQMDYVLIRAVKNKIDVVLPIGPSLRKILTHVSKLDKPGENQVANRYLKMINSYTGIKKEITCHTARHTFGCLCARNKLPKEVTARLMGITVKVVEVYYHLTGESIREQAAILTTL